MTAPTDDEREAAALHLWDEGLVRPESLARAIIESLVAEGWTRDVVTAQQIIEEDGHGWDD